MNPNLLIVALGFRLTGLLLGITAALALVDLSATALMLHRLPPPDTSAPLSVGTYGLVGLLSNGARGIGKGLYALLSGPGLWIVVLLAVAALIALLLAALLYLTGRGIGHHATWARVIAILMSLGLTAISYGAATMMQRNLAPLAAVPIGLSLYTIWVLIWRFA